MCSHICRGQRGVQCLLQSFSHLFYLLIQSLSLNLGLSFQSDWLASKPSTSLSLAPNPPTMVPRVCMPHTGYRSTVLCPSVVLQCWDLSSGPHACTASTLPTEPRIKPHFLKCVFYALGIKPRRVYPYHDNCRERSELQRLITFRLVVTEFTRSRNFNRRS